MIGRRAVSIPEALIDFINARAARVFTMCGGRARLLDRGDSIVSTLQNHFGNQAIAGREETKARCWKLSGEKFRAVGTPVLHGIDLRVQKLAK